MSEDGKIIVSGSDDRTVREWDARTGEALQRLDVDFGVHAVACAEINRLHTVIVASGRSLIKLIRRVGDLAKED